MQHTHKARKKQKHLHVWVVVHCRELVLYPKQKIQQQFFRKIFYSTLYPHPRSKYNPKLHACQTQAWQTTMKLSPKTICWSNWKGNEGREGRGTGRRGWGGGGKCLCKLKSWVMTLAKINYQLICKRMWIKYTISCKITKGSKSQVTETARQKAKRKKQPFDKYTDIWHCHCVKLESTHKGVNQHSKTSQTKLQWLELLMVTLSSNLASKEIQGT